MFVVAQERARARTHACARAPVSAASLRGRIPQTEVAHACVRVCGVQPAALAALAGMTVLTAAGLLRLNVRDVGVTETVKLIFRAKVAPVEHVPGKW